MPFSIFNQGNSFYEYDKDCHANQPNNHASFQNANRNANQDTNQYANPNANQNTNQYANQNTNQSTQNTQWMNHPNLQSVSPEKLIMLNELFNQSSTKKPEELIPFFLSATQKAESMGQGFTNSETDLILDVLKQNMAPQQQSKIETIRKLSQMIYQKKNG